MACLNIFKALYPIYVKHQVTERLFKPRKQFSFLIFIISVGWKSFYKTIKSFF